MTIKLLDQGDIFRDTVTFKNESGTPTDPTTITLKWRKPDKTGVTKTTADPEVSAPAGTGIFTGDIAADQAGRYHVRWIGTGDIVAEEPFEFVVRPRRTS